MDIIRVSMLGMCGVIMGFFLKGTRAEYTAFITMGIGIMILGLAVGKLEYLFQTLGNLQNSISVDPEYFYTLIKMVGITYIGQFSAGICKDAGHQATAALAQLLRWSCLGNSAGSSGQTVSARFPQKTAGSELGKPGSPRRNIQKY